MGELIGRSSEIDLIKSYVNKMRSFHICGPEGIGKTAILRHIYYNWNDLHTPLIPIFCKDSRTLKEILLSIASFMLQRSRTLQIVDKYKRIIGIHHLSDLKDVNSRYLKNMIFNNIGNKKFCVILDRIEYVTPKINAFLTPLKDRTTMITASRQSWDISDYSFSARLDYCLWLLPKVNIRNLSKHDASLLMEQLSGDALTLGEALISDIYQITGGNPGLTRKYVAKVLMPKYFIDGYVNLKLIGIDIKMERAEENRTLERRRTFLND